MDSALGFIAAGVAYGLGGGVAPGPLLALVLAESVRRGPAAGVQVAVAPLLTDPPVILLSLLLYVRIAEPGPLVGIVALAGGGVLLYLAAGILKPAPPLPRPAAGSPSGTGPRRFGPLGRGVAANLTNPHPYLFWLTVGAPTLARARGEGDLAAAGFLGGMYLCLVGAKVLAAVAAGRGRDRLASRYQLLLLRVLAGSLVLLGARSLWDGLGFLYH